MRRLHASRWFQRRHEILDEPASVGDRLAVALADYSLSCAPQAPPAQASAAAAAQPTEAELARQPKRELVAEARRRGISGVSRMTKTQLVAALTDVAAA